MLPSHVVIAQVCGAQNCGERPSCMDRNEWDLLIQIAWSASDLYTRDKPRANVFPDICVDAFFTAFVGTIGRD